MQPNDLFLETKAFLVMPHQYDSYFYLKNVLHHGAKILLSTCVLYFMRQYLPSVKEKPIYHIENNRVSLVDVKYPLGESNNTYQKFEAEGDVMLSIKKPKVIELNITWK